jgi:hypothetical protein
MAMVLLGSSTLQPEAAVRANRQSTVSSSFFMNLLLFSYEYDSAGLIQSETQSGLPVNWLEDAF